MAQDYSRPFYNSKEWIKCRNAFMQSKNYVCEVCNGVAVICHHKEPITPENIHDVNITLNWSNLMAVCHECHQKLHGNYNITQNGLMFDDNGNLVKIPR